MGGNHYEDNVGEARSASTDNHFNYQGHSEAGSKKIGVHKDLDIKGVQGGKKRLSLNSASNPKATAIVVAMDVTRSRGDDAKIMYQKLPMFMGQIYMKGYVPDPAVSFAAIGDATDGDKAPIQVGQFESDIRLDKVLSNIWLEEGGGGGGQESYELMAYYYANHSELDCNRRGQKGYFFFVGDEGFYPQVSKKQVKDLIGDTLDQDIPSAQVFAQLQEKYHVFFIYPRKSWQQRKIDIDAEIKQRVEAAGGQHKDVDIRVSLIWNNRNDLDLHVVAPDGSHLYYGQKEAAGGALDVDKNIQGETTKPVENIRWSKGRAKKGSYDVYVENFRFHESDSRETPFKVEVAVNGKVQHFEGKMAAGLTSTSSRVDIITFNYDPDEIRTEINVESAYSNYDDTKIKTQWAGVIPPENILIIDDPKAIIDVMMGALAITAGVKLDNYLIDMVGRGQSETRVKEVTESLAGLSADANTAKINTGDLPGAETGKKRQGGAKRL
jgi:hypothetical protein